MTDNTENLFDENGNIQDVFKEKNSRRAGSTLPLDG